MHLHLTWPFKSFHGQGYLQQRAWIDHTSTLFLDRSNFRSKMNIWARPEVTKHLYLYFRNKSSESNETNSFQSCQHDEVKNVSTHLCVIITRCLLRVLELFSQTLFASAHNRLYTFVINNLSTWWLINASKKVSSRDLSSAINRVSVQKSGCWTLIAHLNEVSQWRA